MSNTRAPIVQEIIDFIAKNGWADKIEQALKACNEANAIDYENVKVE